MRYGWITGRAMVDLRLREVNTNIYQDPDGIFYHGNEYGDAVCGPFPDEEECHAALMGYCDWLNQTEEEDHE